MSASWAATQQMTSSVETQSSPNRRAAATSSPRSTAANAHRRQVIFSPSAHSPIASHSSVESSLHTPGTTETWSAFMDRSLDSNVCLGPNIDGCDVNDPSKTDAACQANANTAGREPWMDFFFARNHQEQACTLSDCDKCEPSTHAGTTPRPSQPSHSQHVACPSAPVPFDVCSHDDCSISHASLASAIAACCDLPHLTSPMHCTGALPTTCCPDIRTHPSCDPCTIHPSSCTDAACSDESCTQGSSSDSGGGAVDPRPSGSHGHCLPSGVHPNGHSTCQDHSMIPSGGKNVYESFQELLDCCYCTDGRFDPCCSDSRHAASGQVTPATADACLTPTTTCTEGAHSHQPSTHVTSPSTTLSITDGCRFQLPHSHNGAGGCIPPHATVWDNKGNALLCQQQHPDTTCHWTSCSHEGSSSSHGHHHASGQQPATTSSTGGSLWETTPAVPPSTGSSSNQCEWTHCNDRPHSSNYSSSASSHPINVLLHQILEQQHQANVNQQSGLQPPCDWKPKAGFNACHGEHGNCGSAALPPHLAHCTGDGSFSSAASSMSYSVAGSRMGSPMTERSAGSTVRNDSNHHPCGWIGCNEVFTTHEDLTEHVAESHVGGGKSKYVCGWVGCQRAAEGKTFQQRQKILRHIQTHTGDRPFKCSVCSRRFSEQNTLSQHMRTHTREKPYVCDFPGCNASFAVAGSLTIHKRSRHTLERPFVCTWPGCGRAFAESSNLTKHRRVHSGEKPFPCKLCERKFSRPDQLARHMKVHSGHSIDGSNGTGVKGNISALALSPSSTGVAASVPMTTPQLSQISDDHQQQQVFSSHAIPHADSMMMTTTTTPTPEGNPLWAVTGA